MRRVTLEMERESVRYLGEGDRGRAARWRALERLGWRRHAPLSWQQVRAGARAGGRQRPLMWAGAGREGPRQASACMRCGEGVAYLIGALKRNLKQSECFPIMAGLRVAATRTCLDQDMHSVCKA